MLNGFSAVLQTQPWLKIVRTLFVVGVPCSLRELVDLTDVSPGGVRDALRRLRKLQTVKVFKQGNRQLYILTVNEAENRALQLLCGALEEKLVAQRMEKLSLKAVELLSWNEQMLKLWKQGNQLTRTNIGI